MVIDKIMKAYSNLGLPLILSSKPKYDVNNPTVYPTLFLILGTATILVDFQYNCIIPKTNVHTSNNNSKQLLSISSESTIERRITSYTIYVAGSSRIISNRIYSTTGEEIQKAFNEAYNELETIYNDASSLLSANISNYDVVIWRCDNRTNEQ